MGTGAIVSIALCSCGTPSRSLGTPTSTAGTGSATNPPARSVPRSPPRVMVVMMENKGYSAVIGQSDQPYTNTLADRFGLATQSYAFGHPSLPNYLDLVSGSAQGVTDDGPPSSHSFPGSPTIADQLVAAGFSARAYAEDLPSDPTSDSGEYAVRHDPWEYFPNARIVVADASSLIADLGSSRPPDFVWYTPNLIDDEHDGSVEQGDAFLAKFIPEVQATAWYRHGGQIVIEWDESPGSTAGVNGSFGGHVPTIVVSAALESSPRRDTTPVSTAGILRSIERCYGVGYLGGAADPANGNIDSLLRYCGKSG